MSERIGDIRMNVMRAVEPQRFIGGTLLKSADGARIAAGATLEAQALIAQAIALEAAGPEGAAQARVLREQADRFLARATNEADDCVQLNVASAQASEESCNMLRETLDGSSRGSEVVGVAASQPHDIRRINGGLQEGREITRVGSYSPNLDTAVGLFSTASSECQDLVGRIPYLIGLAEDYERSI